MKESPIFSKTYDFLAWLIPLTVKFPRQQRFVLASALQQDALNFQGYLIEAVHQNQSTEKLTAADSELDKLRTHLRLARDLQYIFSPMTFCRGMPVFRVSTEARRGPKDSQRSPSPVGEGQPNINLGLFPLVR